MSRRLVAVLFLDIVGWTGLSQHLDPEPLQLLLEEYYEVCSAAVTQHGGEVEKYIGDAVMAVFGAATSEEDDALRALRAAFQIRSTVHDLLSLNVGALPMEVHCGIAAGEALVTRSSLAGLRVIGDVVNVAARLQAMATAGQILVNETIAQLAGPHFAMVSMPPLAVKGNADLVSALMAIGPADIVVPASEDVRMVDRTAERARMHAAYDRVTRDRRAQVMAVLGPLGIGKTRLVREVAYELGAGEAGGPTVVVGTCPFYGPKESYDALVQVMDALASEALPSRERLQADDHIAAVLASLRDGVLSRHQASGPGPGMEEVSWAARQLLTAAATTGPLVVVWDNLGQAGRSLLRLIGELLVGVEHLPVLMICVGRQRSPELDTSWIHDLDEQDVIQVEALDPADSAQLVASRALARGVAEVEAQAFDVIERVTAYSAGNPLFIELMLESTAPGSPLDHVPPTITAVVGAMIDRLPATARELLGAASVIGPTFTVEQLGFLGVPTASVSVLLERHLIRAGVRNGEYDFVQQPVHEIAYTRLDKERRLAWHRCLTEHDISPAFHLEAACRLLGDLRPHDPEFGQTARDAAEALLLDGTAALRQRDILAAIDLLERALKFAVDGQSPCQATAAVRLSDALLLSGNTRRAVKVITECAAHAADQQALWPCLIQRHLLAVRLGGAVDVTLEQLAADLDRGDADRFAWCRFEQLRMHIHLRSSHFVAADQAVCAALEHARTLADVYEEDRLLVALCELKQWSPTPIEENLAFCHELAKRFARDRVLLIPVLGAQARSLALVGNRVGARAALDKASEAVKQLQLTMGQVVIEQTAGLACSLDGAHLEAEGHFRMATRILQRAGFARTALTMQVIAARACAQHEPSGGAAREIATLLERREDMDVRGRVLCASAAARLAATAGDVHPMLQDILPLLDGIDDPCMRGDVYFDLAQTYRSLGDHTAARALAEAAVQSFATVGASAPIRSVQAWI
jgi:class 3 adenylate cyclase/tetratricopeptide (TPR) repeat protein